MLPVYDSYRQSRLYIDTSKELGMKISICLIALFCLFLFFNLKAKQKRGS